MTSPDSQPAFDAFAGDYDQALNQGLSVSGEDKTYFALGRVRYLASLLARRGARPADLLDFGCGTGSAVPYFLESWPDLRSVVGTDVSAASLEVARSTHASDRVRFHRMSELPAGAAFDLAYCNGVFHHIPPAQRGGAARFIYQALRPGGVFAFWENNPWNPGTRIVMSRIPFDRDAIPLSCLEARRLLAGKGFEIVATRFLFLFPRLLRFLRALEKPLAPLPLGAQYLVLARKPAG